MKSNYKPLGKYIQPVIGRNNDLGDLPLMGLSIQKKFIPSIANTIGTDMSTYRIIEKNQFAYGPVTSRNGDKITIALFNDYEKALISQAYIPFEIKDFNELDPEYLMMWFCRPEFDRYARFKSHGSAREIFDWEEMCNTLLPIPTITKQREIVKEYNVIQNRIALNQALIQKLEETAQAIYKQWFVEFEFPDENGKPYKTNGGEMVFNEELQKEIPKGWGNGDLSMISKKIYSGGTPSTEIDEYWNGKYYWFSSGETGNKYILNTERTITKEGIKNSTTKKAERLNTVIATAGQGKTRGQCALLFNEVYINQSVITVEPLKIDYTFFIFLNVLSRYEELRNDSDAQSIRGSINSNDIKGLQTTVPSENVIIYFHKIVNPFFEIINNKMNQNQKLTELKDLLLSKMASV